MFGRMSRADMAETLGNISDLIPVATYSTLGGIKIGYTNNADQNSRRYGVVLDSNNKAYVEVPWTDTITPDFDDTDLKNLIATERSRIDNFISTLSDTIDAKNRQLFADSQWVEEVFGIPQAEGSIWQNFENEIDHYLNEYMVWDWVDPNDHTKGRTAKISSIEQDIDGITTRVGTAEEGITGITTRTSTLEQTASSLSGRVGAVETQANATDTALAALDLAVTGSGGVRESVATLSTNLSSYETSNNGNLDKLVKMAASILELKTSENGSDITTMANLAAAFQSDSWTGYSGLNDTVTTQGSSITAQNSLMSRVVASTDPNNANYGKPNTTFKSDVIAGLATEAYADGAAAGATASLVAAINDKSAGISVMVTKDANGTIDSNIKLNADEIILNGQTSFKTAVGAFVKTDVLEAGTATIDAATINSATITGTLSGVDGTFSGTLSGASGSFTGDVYANAFRAGSTQGFNITVESDSINFNYGDTPRAWFSTKKYVESANGPVEDTSATNAGGFYLYMISPATGNLVTIDFANLTFKEIVQSGRPTPHRKNLIKLTNGTRTGEVKAETYTVYYTDDDGNGNAASIAYYSDPALTTPLTNAELTDVYMVDDPKDYYNVKYYIAIILDDGSYQAKYPVTRYRGVFMNGTDITTSGGYVYTATYGSGSNAYSRYCTPYATARDFTDADLANGGGAYKFSGGSSNGTYYIQYTSSKTTSTGAMSFFKVNTSGTAMERLQVSAVS